MIVPLEMRRDELASLRDTVEHAPVRSRVRWRRVRWRRVCGGVACDGAPTAAIAKLNPPLLPPHPALPPHIRFGHPQQALQYTRLQGLLLALIDHETSQLTFQPLTDYAHISALCMSDPLFQVLYDHVRFGKMTERVWLCDVDSGGGGGGGGDIWGESSRGERFEICGSGFRPHSPTLHNLPPPPKKNNNK